MHPPSSSDVDSAPSMFALLLLMLRRFLSLLRLSAPVSITHHPTPATLTRLSDSDPAHKFHTRLDELLRRCPSLTGSSAWFTPTFWLASGHAATIYCTIAKFGYLDIGYSRQLLRLPDGGTISLDLTPAASSVNELPEDTPILVTLHGLTGGSHESYCIDVLSRVTKTVERGGLGWRGVVVNFRGCAGTEVTGLDGVPKKLYHGGQTNDLDCALLYLAHAYPKAPLYGLGFSLGANSLAKQIGQAGPSTPFNAAVILGCPWDFYEGHVFLSSSFMGRIYSRAMAANLRGLLRRHETVFEADGRLDWAAVFGNPFQTLYEFDSVVTRILGGFNSTEHYYRSVSANQFATNISIPFLSISATNDPIVSASTIPLSLASLNPFLLFATTSHGGHLGWFEGSLRPRRWISRPILEFLRECERANPGKKVGEQVLVKDVEWRTGAVTKVGDDGIGFECVELGEREVQRETGGLIRGL